MSTTLGSRWIEWAWQSDQRRDQHTPPINRHTPHTLPQGPVGEHPQSQLLLVMRPQGDYVGYCCLEGNLRLKKRKRQEGDEPRPQKVFVWCVGVWVCVDGCRCASAPGGGGYVCCAAAASPLHTHARAPHTTQAEVRTRDYAAHELEERLERLYPMDPHGDDDDAAAAAGAAANGGGADVGMGGGDTAEDIFGGGIEGEEEDEEQGGLGYQ